MKHLLLKMAGGTVVAAAAVLVSSTGASASSGYNDSNNHDYNQSQKHDYDQRDNDNWNRGNDDWSRNNSHSQYKQADYHSDRSYNNNGGQGMWYNSKWYAYNQMGYWDNCGHWVSYRSNWNDNDWKMWRDQHCD